MINVKTSEIIFNRKIDATHPEILPVSITLPMNASELIGGNGLSWNINPENPLQCLFARDISCAIDTNTLSTTQPLNQAYFKANQQNFYTHNPELPAALQFIDLYSKVLHSYGNHQIYTIAYDDELGQSGSACYILKMYSLGTITLGPK